jgi:hypothetical protein
MISVSATEIQKDLDRYVREAAVGPVEVKHGDDARSYLISERFLRDLLSSYRRAKPVQELSDEDGTLIQQAKVITDTPYNLDDIPEIDDTPSFKP